MHGEFVLAPWEYFILVPYSSILVFLKYYLCGNFKRSFRPIVMLFIYFLHYLFMYCCK